MTLRKIGWLLSLCSLAMVGCQSGGKKATTPKAPAAATAKPAPAKPAAAPAAPAAPAKPAVDPAKAVGAACAAVIATGGAEAKLAPLSTADLKKALASPKAKKGMMEAFKGAKCGTPKVDGTKATVTVTAGKKSRDIPFVKDGDAWKFDVAAYAAKYPEKAGKKGKKGKHHGRRHHKRK